MVKQGYKQTEIGVIPEDWEVKELNTLSKITRLAGYEYSTYWKEDKNGEIIGLRGFNIGKNKIIERELSFISDSLSKKLNRSRLYKNDIIYPCVGTIGNACVITEDDKYHIQQNIAKITPNISLVEPYYLSHFLMSDFGLKEIERFNGSSSQPNVLVGSLRKYNIILPPLPEQEAIASALSDADAWIESLAQLIAKKRLIKQGAMQELLTPPDGTVHGVEPWEVKKLGDCLNYIQPTPFLVKSTEYNPYNDIPVLTAGKTFILGYTDENFGVFDKLPTIIFDDFTTASKYVDFPFKAKSSAMKMLVLKDNSNYLKFLFDIMQVLKFQVGDHKRHWIGEFQNLEIKVPSLSEQTRIATILSDMDAELEALEQQLAKARQIKQGMMQELLTGRVRLL